MKKQNQVCGCCHADWSADQWSPGCPECEVIFYHPSRRGISLIEILVAVAITAILSSLGFVMVKNYGQTARDAQTHATLMKVHAGLEDRYESLGRFFETADRRTVPGNAPLYVIGQNRIDWSQNPGNQELYRLLGRKKFERKAFPTNFDEAWTASGVSSVTGLPQGQFPSGHDSVGDTESAEVLYWILTNGAVFGSESIGVVDFTDREIADTDGDGLLEVVDGWGNPLRFYRWPTRLIRPRDPLSETIPSQNFNDPPANVSQSGVYLLGKLPLNVMSDNQDPTALVQFSGMPADQFENDYHTPNTWHAPLVVSAGPDGEFGLYSPATERTYFGHLAQPLPNATDQLMDNMTNLMLKGR